MQTLRTLLPTNEPRKSKKGVIVRFSSPASASHGDLTRRTCQACKPVSCPASGGPPTDSQSKLHHNMHQKSPKGIRHQPRGVVSTNHRPAGCIRMRGSCMAHYIFPPVPPCNLGTLHGQWQGKSECSRLIGHIHRISLVLLEVFVSP